MTYNREQHLKDVDELNRKAEERLKNLPYNPNQKYQKGDRVRIIEPLPSSMSHFNVGCGVIKGSYEDQFGRQVGSEPDYTVIIDDHGEVSWYPESVLEYETEPDTMTILENAVKKKR